MLTLSGALCTTSHLDILHLSISLCPPSYCTLIFDLMRNFYTYNAYFFILLPPLCRVGLVVRAATNESQKTLNKCETRNKTVIHTRLRHPENDKQCSAKQCFANQTNRCLAGIASQSDLFRDNARLTKHRRKVNQRHLILQAMYTTM